MSARCFAIVPAAGHSKRMGQPKLLLPLGGRPLIAHVVGAWQRSKVDHVLVVVRPGDEPLAKAVRDSGAIMVMPECPPPDMKASVQAALRYVESNFAPLAEDAFLVAPADMPKLSTAIIDRLIREYFAGDHSAVLVPAIGERRGHPVLFPWAFARAVLSLPADQGINVIVEQTGAREIACTDVVAASQETFADVDTPEDWRRLNGE